MNKVICIQQNHDNFSYGFKINNIYDYFKTDEQYFVIKNNVRYGYDKIHFDKQFIDERKLKIIKLSK